MERQLIAAFLAAIILSLQVAAYTDKTFTADNTFLQKQKNLFELFWHADQPTIYHPELYQISKSWNIIDHVDDYTNKEVVHEFLRLWKLGMTPRGEVFSPWYPDIQKEIVALYDLFFFAKDYDTFYNTAVWARFNVNEHMFNYMLALAIIHRPDTKHIRLPNLYEIIPHYFFNEDVIERAQRIKMGDVTAAKKAVTGNEPYILQANYSGWYLAHDHDTEWKLNYFTEDVGMNTYYFYQNAMFPYWLSSEKYNLLKGVRGQMYYFSHKHLLARYYLERLSNDLGELEWLDWDKPIVTGYYPTLVHPTGLPFPQRPTWSYVPVHKYEQVERIHHLESRIMMSIDNGRIEKHDNKPYELYENTLEDMNHLGNIIQGNRDSLCRRYYDSVDKYARNILGFGHERSTKYQPIVGSLDMSLTSMRDPGFYRMYKKILNFFIRYKSNLPTYTHEELVFPGVKIESVAVDKLVTYFDNFESMINNAVAVKSHKEAQSIVIKARQQRLNHKPFTYHLTVNSDKATKAWIHIYLGPKYDVHGHEIEMIDNWMNFFEMDYWVADLKSGMNKIERSSHESIFVVPDTSSSIDFYKMITKALEGGESYKYSGQMYGIPDRMMLPKGKPEGMPLKLFVYVSPYVEEQTMTVEFPVFGTKHFEKKPIGFPLDRSMYHYHKTVPNMYWKDVTIFHKNVEELNVTV